MPIRSILGGGAAAHFSAAALTVTPFAIDRVVYSCFKNQNWAAAAGATAVLGCIAMPNISNHMKAVITLVYLAFKACFAIANAWHIRSPTAILGTQANTPSTIPSCAFGAAKWAQYIGDVGVEPPIPPSLLKDFESRKDTHFLVLVPQTVNGKPLTMEYLKELVGSPKTGHATKFSIWDLGDYQDTPALASHWVLMTRTVDPRSRNLSYPDQQKLVADIAEKDQVPYEIPNILDATTAICMDYVQSGKSQYDNSPWTYTRTTDKWNDRRQLIVGGLSSDGFYVCYGIFDIESYGVSLLRKS